MVVVTLTRFSADMTVAVWLDEPDLQYRELWPDWLITPIYLKMVNVAQGVRTNVAEHYSVNQIETTKKFEF